MELSLFQLVSISVQLAFFAVRAGCWLMLVLPTRAS